MKNEISLRELLESDFKVGKNGKMFCTFTLERVNKIADILINLQQENEDNLKCIKSIKEQFSQMEYKIGE